VVWGLLSCESRWIAHSGCRRPGDTLDSGYWLTFLGLRKGFLSSCIRNITACTRNLLRSTRIPGFSTSAKVTRGAGPPSLRRAGKKRIYRITGEVARENHFDSDPSQPIRREQPRTAFLFNPIWLSMNFLHHICVDLGLKAEKGPRGLFDPAARFSPACYAEMKCRF